MTNEMQGIIRVENRKKYTKIDDRLTRDTRLSRSARGLACEILTNWDDWEISVAYLVKYGKEGKHAVKRMIKELIKFGYLWMSDKDLRNDKGQFCGKQYVLYEHWSDNPHFDPSAVLPEAVEPEIIEDFEDIEELNEVEEPEIVEEPEAIEEPELVFNGGTKNYSNARKEEIKRLLADCPQAQDVLDEVSYRIQQGKVRNPMGLLVALKERAIKGEFIPTHDFRERRTRIVPPVVSVARQAITDEERERRRKVSQEARQKIRQSAFNGGM